MPKKRKFQWKQKAYPIWKLERNHSDPVWWKHSISVWIKQIYSIILTECRLWTIYGFSELTTFWSIKWIIDNSSPCNPQGPKVYFSVKNLKTSGIFNKILLIADNLFGEHVKENTHWLSNMTNKIKHFPSHQEIIFYVCDLGYFGSRTARFWKYLKMHTKSHLWKSSPLDG